MADTIDFVEEPQEQIDFQPEPEVQAPQPNGALPGSITGAGPDYAQGLIKLVEGVPQVVSKVGGAALRTGRDVFFNPPGDFATPPKPNQFIIGPEGIRQMTPSEAYQRLPLAEGRGFFQERRTQLQPTGSDAGRLLESLSTPENISLLAAGTVNPVAGYALLATMAPGIAKQVKDIAGGELSPEDKRDQINSLIMPLAIGLGHLKPEAAKLSPAEEFAAKPPPNLIQGPLPEGRVLATPPGAPVPVGEPPASPQTVTPEQAIAAAKAMSKEATASYEPAPLPRPEVPQGPSDPRVIQARQAEADTIPKVLALFPEMKGNREAARIILKQVKELAPEPAPAPQVPTAPEVAPAAPETPEVSAVPPTPEIATLGTSTAPIKDTLGNPIGTKYYATPEDWAKWQDIQDRKAKAMADKDLPAFEKIMGENESLKNKYGGNPPLEPKAEAEPAIEETPAPAPTPIVRGPATTADILGKVSAKLDAQADAARARLAARRGKTTFGSGPLHEIPNIADYAVIGAAKIARGATEFARWSTEMVKDFGEAIRPHLAAIFTRAQQTFDDHASVVTRVNRVLFEAGLPRREIAAAGKRAIGKSIESGAEAGKALSGAESAPKLAQLQEQLSDSIPKAQALREYFRGQEVGGVAGREAATKELKLADKWLEADSQRIRQSLVEFANASLPVTERGRFLKAIADATKRPPLLKGDPEVMYRQAARVAARIEDRATDVRKAGVAKEIKESVSKALQSPGVDIGYKQRILEAVRRIAFTKPSEATVDALKATRDFLNRQQALGKDVEMPKEVLNELEVLGKIPVRELPEHVLEAMRDRVNLLEQLGRLKVKSRKRAWEIEKTGKLNALAGERTNPISERPEFRQQPGEARPMSVRIRNWANRQLNMGSLLDKALLPIDALFDLLGDAKGAYRGWLFKNVRNPLDLDYNSAQVMRDSLSAPVEAIAKKYNLGEREAERIGVYAASLQEGGVARLTEMGVKPATIDNILKTISPAEMKAYQAMRTAMDSTLPKIQKLMHELYNIEVKPVPDYFPMPRDWNLYEPEPKPLAEPGYGKEMDFDELAGWKQMLGDFTSPKTTKTERGFTLERQKGAETPIKLNAFDVFQQHMNDVAYLLKTQRDLKMIGEMTRSEVFKEKYGGIGQNIVNSWLDTVARQGQIGGFRRIPALDELRRRTSAGVIGFRLASQFVHLSNVPLAVWRSGGPLWWKAGLGEALTKRGQAFLKDNFAETYTRGGGEPALVEASERGAGLFGKQVVPKEIVKAGFAIARKIDQYNSQATTLAIYLRLLAEKGIDPRTYDKIPVDKTAQAEALVLSRRAVASPLPKDVSASLARGAITGGNISLGRTIFQFQNIFQDQWSNIRHDLARAGIREKNPKLAATAFVALSAMLLAEMGIRETSKEVISSLTGYKPKKEPSAGERIAIEAARRIPFGGQITSQIVYGETGVPVIDSILDTEKALKTVATAKKEATQTKALVRAVAGAAQLGGVPGASQVGELIQKAQ